MNRDNTNKFVFLVICDSLNLGVLQTISEEIPGTHRFVSCIKETLSESMAGDAYKGIVIDNETLRSMPKEGRALIEDLRDSFPILFLDQRTIQDKEHDSDAFWNLPALKSFMQAIDNGEFRTLRLDRRVSIPLKAILTDGAGTTVRSVSANLSAQGAFFVGLPELIPNWVNGRKITVHFSCWEQENINPINAEIRWVSPWSSREKKFPGYGVQFINLSKKQSALVNEAIMGAHKDPMTVDDAA